MIHTIILASPGGIETVPYDGPLKEAKRYASSMSRPGRRISIETARGTTWTLGQSAQGFAQWRHDTGRKG